MIPAWVVWVGAAIGAGLLLRAGLAWWCRPGPTTVDVLASASGSPQRLVVVAHGLSGRESVAGLVSLIRTTFLDADCAVLCYDSRPTGNADPFAVANFLETEVDRLLTGRDYGEVLLVGHSAGGALLRKMFVWAAGQEDDRLRFGRRGRRRWIARVSRIVMLAGINRGWSVEDRPAMMALGPYLFFKAGLRVARMLGVATYAREIYRGAPFIADTRVQWLRLARAEAVVAGRAPFPQVIQLIGDHDDLVSKGDGMDLVASRGIVFKTLPQTTHQDICAVVADASRPEAAVRAACIRHALLGDLTALGPDLPDPRVPEERREIDRVIYVLHGIRDFGEWTDVLRRELEARIAVAGERAVVTNLKYGYFPLLPFILYRDRQKNVRRFMDEYTENLAQFPNAQTVDFVGHSNGTYILASALARYETPRVRRVFFAGSVVPKHYPWADLIAAGRVQQVVNVAAATDWVVAIFPKLFEQIADWLDRRPTQGWLDIGAAGFRGFMDSGEAGGHVRDVKFTRGDHSAGVEVSVRDKLDAIVSYIVTGDTGPVVATFDSGTQPPGWLQLASNLSYLTWALLVTAVLAIGWVIGTFVGTVALTVYVLLVVALLHSF